MLKESYLVCHCGKKKSFKEKSKALEHADALAKLGYGVKVYLLIEDLISEVRIIVWASDSNYLKEAFKNFLVKGGKSNG